MKAHHFNLTKLSPGDHRVRIDILPDQNERSQGSEIWLLQPEWDYAEIPFRDDPEFQRRANKGRRYGTQAGRLTSVELLDEQETLLSQVHYGQKVTLRMHALSPPENEKEIMFSFIVRNRNGVDLFGTCNYSERTPLIRKGPQLIMDFTFIINLPPGQYSILAALVYGPKPSEGRPGDVVDIAYVFEVGWNPDRPVYYLFYNPIEVSQRG